MSPVDGNWTDPTKWSSNPYYPNNGTPGPADTYVVAISASGAPYTITADASAASGGTFAVDGLTLDSADATLKLAGGGFQVGGPLNLNAGSLQLTGATLRGAAISGSGGQMTATGGVLDSVTLGRDVAINDGVYLGNPLTVRNGLLFQSGSMTITNLGNSQNIAVVNFDGEQTLGGTGSLNLIGDYRSNLHVMNGTLTVAAGVSISGSASINYTSNVINEGTIRATSTMFVEGAPAATFMNKGTIESAPGGTLLLEGPFDNSGGVIRTTGGIISIGNASTEGVPFTTAQIGTLQNTGGGTIGITGTLNNTGATLAATDSTRNIGLDGVMLTGGRLVTGGSAQFQLSGTTTIFDSVTLAGHLDVHPTDPQGGAILQVHNLALDGGTLELHTENSQAELQFHGDETVAGTGQIVINGNGIRIDQFGGTLTLAPGVTLRHLLGSVNLGSTGAAPALVNQGTISEEGTGLTVLALANHGLVQAKGSAAFLNLTDVTNPGTITADGGTVSLSGNWTSAGGQLVAVNQGTLDFASAPAAIGAVSLTNSTLVLHSAYATSQIPTTGLNGSVLVLSGSAAVLDNSNGSLSLAGGNTLQLSGGTAQGGTIVGDSGSRVLVPFGATGTLSGVTLGVGTTVQEGATLNLTGNVVLQSATVSLTGGLGRGGVLVAQSPLTGTGEIVFDAPGGPGQVEGTGQTLTIGPGVTVRTGAGSGIISTPLVNQGTISAETAGQAITILNGPFTNGGTLEAKNGGTLLFSNVTNSGTIAVSGPSSLTLSGAWSNSGLIAINTADLNLGGSFSTSGIGTITRSGGSVTITGALDNTGSTLLLDDHTGSWNLAGGTVSGGTVRTAGAAHLIVPGAASGTLSGVTLDGTLELQGSTLLASAGLTAAQGALTGTGTVLLSGAVGANFIRPLSNTLHVPSGISVSTQANDATIGAPGAALVNDGTIVSQVPGKTISVTGALTNNGTIQAVNGGKVRIVSPSDLTNLAGQTLSGGQWVVSQGSTLDLPGVAIGTNAADVTLNGPTSFFPALDSVSSNSGRLRLGGGRNLTTQGDFANSGTVSLGAGSRLWTANFSQSSAGTVQTEIAGGPASGDVGQLRVSGIGSLDGTLAVSVAQGFNPQLGDVYPFLTAQTLGGQFASVVSPQTGGSGRFLPLYSTGAVRLEYVPQLTGDINFNGLVGFDDLLILAQHYGTQSGALWTTGDLNGDGSVGFDDLLLLAQNYGRSGTALPQAGSLAAVPEPALLVLILAGAWAYRRPRSRRPPSQHTAHAAPGAVE